MSDPTESRFGVNSWLEDELYQQYLNDRQTVPDSWRPLFEQNGGGNGHAKATNGNGVPAPTAAVSTPAAPVKPTPIPGAQPALSSAEQAIQLKGVAAKIAENMEASLAIPTATSQRVIAVKVIEENRQLINQYRGRSNQSKISYTHIIGWAIVKALETNPSLNNSFSGNGAEMYRIVRPQVNLGLAVDVAGKDGNRSLMVPSIKNANEKNFRQFLDAYDDIVARARTGKLALPDFQGTTISLTNPGTMGTLGSVPRLVQGQGAIIATGAIDYPAEYQGVAPSVRTGLGLSKVMMMTCTYDHRIIQGAESGMFLARIQALLQGEDGFYEGIFRSLEIPYPPFRLDRQGTASPMFSGGRSSEDTRAEVAVGQLINAYRLHGHFLADLDPLGQSPSFHPELDPAYYGLTMWDLDREFSTGNLQLVDKKGRPRTTAPLRDILDALREIYCGKVGSEYMYIQEHSLRRWIQNRIEPTRLADPLDAPTRLRILDRLLEAEEFERFLDKRFLGKKRFSLEGGESAIALLDTVLSLSTGQNVHEVVIGMAHRGRLNVLANVVGKPIAQIFSEFEDYPRPETEERSGDVKYHLGASGVYKSPEGKELVVSLAFNPSHLEAVDPVVEGIVRPKQDRLGDTSRERVIPILIHGDAAFAGQGVVMETLNLSQLDGYSTGGTIHIIINNQLGFTTLPQEARSSSYASDVARTIQAPIFHVNGDDPEAVVRVARLAYQFRQQFKKDVVIDMYCYRFYGHNETDDPGFTQPVLYKKIKQHASVAKQYSQRLVKDKLLDAETVEQMRKRINARLGDIHDAIKKQAQQYETHDIAVAPGAEAASQTLPPSTAISPAMVEHIVKTLTTLPPDFHMYAKLEPVMNKRRELLNGGMMDWALGEALAFGSLALDGTPVRLSGQDAGRGTFTQRQLVYFDTEDGDKKYVPLQHLSESQAPFNVYNSSLSEYAVMGFEFGYSLAEPTALVLWEAQFGDFVNGAQIIIDQFLSSAETKWGQPSGLVLLLPHGYEGQGPEHSSARVERFLQLCAENNMQVANCTTPAQYFHLLRRQMHGGPDRRGLRKPLIVCTPKSLLRSPKAVSTMQEVTAGSFRPVIGDDVVASKAVRVLFCTGKVYYDLVDGREKSGRQDVAIVRVEQLYPFPAAEFLDVLNRYPASADIVWVQEEPRNMGAWRFVQEQMQSCLEGVKRSVRYIGRPESASPASGSEKRHKAEQAELVEAAFAAAPVTPTRKRSSGGGSKKK